MTARIKPAALVLLATALTVTACSGDKPAVPPPEQKPAASQPAAPPATAPSEEALPPSQLDTMLPEGVRDSVLRPFTGDFDEMVKRRIVRIGVTFNRTFYFVDKGVQRGIAYDYGRLCEDRINAAFKTGNMKVFVIFVPLPRSMLMQALIDGKVDLVAAQLTVTPDRQKIVDFTNATRADVNEIVVTGPSSPASISTLEDLSGQEVFVRRTSSYYQSLVDLNAKFKAEKKPPVLIQAAPENLEDDDLLEMVSAGLLPAVVVDNYLATFWKKVFPNLNVHDDVAVRTGGTLAVAIRKNSPQLGAALNRFMANYGLGTAFGDSIERKYLVRTTYVKSASSQAERKKFMSMVQLFRKYSEQYSMDFLLMAAQGYQESQLNQDAKSHVGAIGVMQIMPATGKELNVGDITKLEPNINGGVKYMHTLMDKFYKDAPMDSLNKGLFTFASYNAGPGRVAQLRKEAEKRGLDPNVWFGNVEQITSERIGRETVTYVSNIYKYYIAYRLVLEENERRTAAKAALTKTKQVK